MAYYKRPATYCNKADRALQKAWFYMEKLESRTLMGENENFLLFLRRLEAARELLDKVCNESYMTPADWEQNKLGIKAWKRKYGIKEE